MKALAICGMEDNPNKVSWLRERGIDIRGAQIVMSSGDLFPSSLLGYKERLLKFVKETAELERISVMISPWPQLKMKDNNREVIDVAMVSVLDSDHFSYAVSVCKALQDLYEETGVATDISYHPLMTWPRISAEKLSISQANAVQEVLIQHDSELRSKFIKFLSIFDIHNVGINIENEPPVSDEFANLIHTGNRLFSEQILDLPSGWGVTADLQHCAMLLNILENSSVSNSANEYCSKWPLIGSFSTNSMNWNWGSQINCLNNVSGSVTFHLSQLDDSFRHTNSTLRFNDPLMDWPLILSLIKKLDEKRNENIWYAVEAGAFPNYESDYESYWHMQRTFA